MTISFLRAFGQFWNPVECIPSVPTPPDDVSPPSCTNSARTNNGEYIVHWLLAGVAHNLTHRVLRGQAAFPKYRAAIAGVETTVYVSVVAYTQPRASA
jgi:hypothetical protein